MDLLLLTGNTPITQRSQSLLPPLTVKIKKIRGALVAQAPKKLMSAPRFPAMSMSNCSKYTYQIEFQQWKGCGK